MDCQRILEIRSKRIPFQEGAVPASQKLMKLWKYPSTILQPTQFAYTVSSLLSPNKFFLNLNLFSDKTPGT